MRYFWYRHLDLIVVCVGLGLIVGLFVISMKHEQAKDDCERIAFERSATHRIFDDGQCRIRLPSGEIVEAP